MHYAADCGRREVSVIYPFLVASMAMGAAQTANAGKVYVFSTAPNTTFQVRKNNLAPMTVTSTALGSLHLQTTVSAGDRFDVVPASSQPPAPPLGVTAGSEAPSCATVRWSASVDPAIAGYVVYFGTVSVAGGRAQAYEQSFHVGRVTQHTLCALPSGIYYFAVRARTANGALSPYSSERSVPIQTTSAFIAVFDAKVAGDAVRLSWRIASDETILGFRLYRSDGGAVESLIVDGIDAGASSFVDATIRPGQSYGYVLAAMLEDGAETRSFVRTVETPARALALEQNRPNPFNPSTQIPFTLEQTGRVVVRVFDVAGSHVATVFDGQLAEGRQTVDWDGRDVRGHKVASGVYLYTLSTESRTLSKKMVMLK